MSVTLVVEDGTGLANSNSYASIFDADSYHDRRLHTQSWARFTDDQKIVGLVWATSVLDQQLDWKGDPSSTGQALRWPRLNVRTRDGNNNIAGDEIPQWLIDATSEMARHLIEKDRLDNSENQNVKSRTTRAGTVDFGPRDKRARIIPPSVESIVTPYVVKGSRRAVRT